MGDKFDGALAGGGRASTCEVGIAEALQTLSLNETLVAADEDGALVLLQAVQNPYHGGIMVLSEEGKLDSPAMTDAIKLSQMTSMLSDESRCSKYAEAISRAIQIQEQCSVLDIGSGTGLLAMLAARSGAHRVDAIEMFAPLADLARRVIEENALQSKVSVLPTKSTDLSVQDSEKTNGTMVLPRKADVLVTEIFDSSLLGEACIPVIAHAHKELLAKDATVVPAKASLFATLLSSDFFSRFQDLGPNFPLYRSETSRTCRAGCNGIPIHIDALKSESDYVKLTKKFTVFDFSFVSKDLLSENERIKHLSVPRIADGPANAVLTWWELDLTGKGDIVYSTEPGKENWQDHWLPVIYPLPAKGLSSPDSKSIPLSAGHNQISFWFTFGVSAKSPPPCSCGFHALPGGPYRISELGDAKRLESLRQRILAVLHEVHKSASIACSKRPCIRCIDISDSSICALLAGQVAGDIHVQVVSVEEDNEVSAFLYEQVSRAQLGEESKHVQIEYNPLSEVIERELALRGQEEWHGFDVVLSEPYTRAMQAYPLSTFGNLIVQRRALSEVLAPDFLTIPRIGRVKAKAIQFAPGTLQKAFGAVHDVLGLDHRSFAQLYSGWPGGERISLPLFQYMHTTVSQETVLSAINLCHVSDDDISVQSTGLMRLHSSSPPEAIVLWVEYDDEPQTRVARSEVVWLSEHERTAMAVSGAVEGRCAFQLETGSFTVRFSAIPTTEVHANS